MLSEQIKDSKNNTSQQISKKINDYFIKIDYFDQKGTKNFEDNVPLKCLFKNDTNLSKTY